MTSKKIKSRGLTSQTVILLISPLQLPTIFGQTINRFPPILSNNIGTNMETSLAFLAHSDKNSVCAMGKTTRI